MTLVPSSRKEPAGLTIIVPSWNHRAYLPRCLMSARAGLDQLKRNGFSGEIVVIDDASRDGSQKLLRSLQMLADPADLLTVFLPENCGLPFVRNLGLRLAAYRYALLLDADNELVPDNLPAFVRTIRETSAALVYGNLLERRQGDTECTGIRSHEPATLRLTDANYVDAFALVDVAVVLRVGGYTTDPRLYGCEDWEMILHLIAEEQAIVFVPLLLGYYYISPLSMSSESSREGEMRLRAMRRMYAQTGTREWDPRRVGRVYHPEVGFLDSARDWNVSMGVPR